ncbi:MAG: hypothetical protein ACRC9L_06075 [Brevinema sp.]
MAFLFLHVRKDGETMLKGKRAYICSPLSAPTGAEMCSNMMAARGYEKRVAELCGCRTFAPHAYLPTLLNDHVPEERALALKFGIDLLRICDALVICGGRISAGMKGEIAMANQLGIKVYHLVEHEDAVGVVEKSEVIL